MSRLTVRLPETLHHQLAAQAKREGVSLNQYVVYALTRQLTQSYTVQRMSEETVAQQKAQFSALLQALGQASPTTLPAALAAREQVEPEPALTPEVVTRLQARLAKASPHERSGR
jgi:HicB family